MKSGQIFWGVFLLSIGALILLNRYDLINVSWSFVWDLWPVILILWGLAIITRETFLKPLVTVLTALFVAAVLYGFFYNIVDDIDDHNGWSIDFSDSRTFYEEYDPKYEFADLKLSSGVGIFTIKDRTSNLIKGYQKGSYDDYSFRVNDSDNRAKIYIELDKNFHSFTDQIDNKLELQLNKEPVWDLDLNLGAAKSYFDLTTFKVARLELNTGATRTRIKIGDKYPDTKIDVSMGAASLDIFIPQDAGCMLEGDMVLVLKELEGFDKVNSERFETPNFDSAKQKIRIRVEGGISSLKINRN
ncbi:MAG: hypothetical protein JW995_00250 [Melioribacteraceae bacterium]|nr:hypothetical protein [Melioribacteraceae bacterium]